MSKDAFNWLPGGAEGENDGNPIEQNEEMQRAYEAALLQQAKNFYEVFGTPKGNELLNHLRDRTIEVPLMNMSQVLDEGREFGVNPSEWAFYRDGQNSVIRYIEKQLRIVVDHATAAQQEISSNGKQSKTTGGRGGNNRTQRSK